jgi:hypothetical protein
MERIIVAAVLLFIVCIVVARCDIHHATQARGSTAPPRSEAGP